MIGQTKLGGKFLHLVSVNFSVDAARYFDHKAFRLGGLGALKVWRNRQQLDHLIVNLAAQTPEAILAPKVVPGPALQAAAELGAGLAEGLATGVF